MLLPRFDEGCVVVDEEESFLVVLVLGAIKTRCKGGWTVVGDVVDEGESMAEDELLSDSMMMGSLAVPVLRRRVCLLYREALLGPGSVVQR